MIKIYLRMIIIIILRCHSYHQNKNKKILYDISINTSYWSVGIKYNISHTAVSRIFKKFCKDGDKSLVLRSGRKYKLEKYEILRMKRISNGNPFLCGREVRDQALLNNKISIPTANRYIRELGLFGRKAKHMNFHNKKHMARRRQFCNVVKNWILKSCDKWFLRTKSEWN